MDTATPSFKFPHPTPFNGKRDGFSIIGFLKRMDFFFDGAGIAEPRKIAVTLAFAGDEVIAWWALLNRPSTTPFKEFSDLLSTEFSPAKFKEHILALTMKMTMSLPLNIPNVMAYITKAREYHLLLQTYYNDNAVLNDTIRTAFLNGAPAQLRQMLEVAIINAGEDRIDLPKLFKAAEEFGRIFHSGDSSLGAKALAVTGSSAGITNSMARKLITLVLPPWLLFYRRSTISASRSTISRDTTAALVDSPQKNAKTSLTRMAVSVAAKSMPDISLPIAPRTRPLLADLSITYHLLTRVDPSREMPPATKVGPDPSCRNCTSLSHQW